MPLTPLYGIPIVTGTVGGTAATADNVTNTTIGETNVGLLNGSNNIDRLQGVGGSLYAVTPSTDNLLRQLIMLEMCLLLTLSNALRPLGGDTSIKDPFGVLQNLAANGTTES